MDAQFWTMQILNGVTLGSLLFLVASGFTLIFGLMRIANLTHGALICWGGTWPLLWYGPGDTGPWPAWSLPSLWPSWVLPSSAFSCGGCAARPWQRCW